MTPNKRARAVADLLADAYPEGRTELDVRGPWQLLVATVLSAQCTDERVNSVTPALFARWPGPEEMAAVPLAELEEAIRPTGFFRNKARSLQGAARAVVADHGGTVPRTMDELVELPGVGRKTATVILGEGFGIPAGVTVDTHVRRVSRRLGLTAATDPDRIADELQVLLPADRWVRFSMRMILHGRRVCTARKPRCRDCVVEKLCPKVGV